jgi:hypothetical protein
VAGVVGDVRSAQLESDPTLMVYVPFWRQPWQASHLVVRSTADPRSLPEQVRRVIREIDPGIPAPKTEATRCGAWWCGKACGPW